MRGAVPWPVVNQSSMGLPHGVRLDYFTVTKALAMTAGSEASLV